MEGEKEVAEEKEEEEEEKKELHHHIAATSSVDYPDLPIMHWEDLSQRIAELEKQEQERRERSKVICLGSTVSSCLPAEGGRGEGAGESGGSVERRLGGRGGRLQEVSGCCRHITISQPQKPAAVLHQQQRQRRRGGRNQQKGFHGNRGQRLPCRGAETGSGHRSEDAERQTAGRTEGEGASGRQQRCCQAETSGALGAARVFSAAAQQLESISSTGRARSELRAGGPPVGTRPAEDEAGRHAARRSGPDLAPGQSSRTSFLRINVNI